MTLAILLFLGLVAGSASFFHWAIIQYGFTMPLATWLMWSVGLSAILALKLSGKDLSGLGWKWGSARHHLIAFILPIIYGAVAYFSASAAGLVDFPVESNIQAMVGGLGFGSLNPTLGIVIVLFLMLTAGFVSNMATALGEEIGWRGFLTSQLTAKTGFLVATVITGVLWAGWHTPILLFSDYNGGGEKFFEVISFVVMIIAISGAFAWLRLDSGSLWPAATLHASHNLALQMILDPITVRGQSPVTMVGEFGVVTALTCVLVCLPFWIAGMRAARRPGAADR